MAAEDLWTLTDLATPWAAMVVVTLGVPELTAGRPVTIATLADQVNADPDALLRVVRHLAGRGLFTETDQGIALTEQGRMLLGHNPGLDLEGIGGRMAGAWTTLLQTVRTGRASYADAFGRPFWEDLAAHPAVASSFDAMMGPAGHDMPDPNILPGGDWTGIQTVVDVGGSLGALLVSLLREHPDLRGTLVDLPETVARAGPFFAEHGVTDRVTLAPQSFFDPLPRGGDLYVVRHVLNDWPDLDKVRILRRCAEAMEPGARLVVLGGVDGDAASDASPELLMLVLVGAGNTPLTRFRELAAEGGLEVLDATRSDAHHHGVTAVLRRAGEAVRAH